ncbi:MAG: hypothetical protein AAFS10_20895, partial [Myxococcota bacterium]
IGAASIDRRPPSPGTASAAAAETTPTLSPGPGTDGGETRTKPSSSRTWVQWARVPVGLFLLSAVLMSLLSWERVKQPSADTHFVYLANAMLAGQLQLDKKPPHKNDWATYEWMRLRSGEEIRGIWLDRNTRRFKTLDGRVMVIDRPEVDPRARETRYFVSFPPGPAVLMVPLAAIWGYAVNDVVFTLLFAALNVALCFIVLRRLSERGLTERTLSDNLWLTLLFGFGTVHLWCSVLGQVWFTALIVGATFTWLYILAAIDARHPLLAGICLAGAFATRTPLLFSVVFFVGFVLFPGGRLLQREAYAKAVRTLVVFGAPCLVVGCLLLWANHVRFESWTEFGHSYLAGGQLQRIRRFGLFNIHFLSKNLSAALTLLPRIQPEYPFVIVSRHGMSLLLTTPAWVYLFMPRERKNADAHLWWRLTWATAICVAIPALFYQNTGYEQFGYRFSIDYTPYLVMLLAIGRRPLTWVFKVAIVVGVAVNTFGAITFKRFDQFYMPGSTFFDPD